MFARYATRVADGTGFIDNTYTHMHRIRAQIRSMDQIKPMVTAQDAHCRVARLMCLLLRITLKHFLQSRKMLVGGGSWRI